MFTLGELDNRLALKLGDPVTNNSKGELFDLEQRVNYLSRAYGRLIRTLKQVMGSYAPQFSDTTKFVQKQLDDFTKKVAWQEVDFSKDKVYLEKVEEAYLFYSTTINPLPEPIPAPPMTEKDGKGSYKKIIMIDNKKWLSTINNENDLQKPDLAKGIFYGTIINNSLCITPLVKNPDKLNLDAIIVTSPIYFDDSDLEQPVNISGEYIDILLTMAASEGMADAARSDKFQMFVADVNNQITSITNYITLQLQLEGKHSGK